LDFIANCFPDESPLLQCNGSRSRQWAACLMGITGLVAGHKYIRMSFQAQIRFDKHPATIIDVHASCLSEFGSLNACRPQHRGSPDSLIP